MKFVNRSYLIFCLSLLINFNFLSSFAHNLKNEEDLNVEMQDRNLKIQTDQNLLNTNHGHCRADDELIVYAMDKAVRHGFKNPPLDFNFSMGDSVSGDSDVKNLSGVLEGFIRFKEDVQFSLLHTFVFKFNVHRNIIYYCVEKFKDDPQNNRVKLVFLDAFGITNLNLLDRADLSTLPGDLVFGPGGLADRLSTSDKVVSITPIAASVAPLNMVTNSAPDMLSKIPIFGSIFKIPLSTIEFSGLLFEKLQKILSIGIERIEIVGDKVRFSNGVITEEMNLPEPVF